MTDLRPQTFHTFNETTQPLITASARDRTKKKKQVSWVDKIHHTCINLSITPGTSTDIVDIPLIKAEMRPTLYAAHSSVAHSLKQHRLYDFLCLNIILHPLAARRAHNLSLSFKMILSGNRPRIHNAADLITSNWNNLFRRLLTFPHRFPQKHDVSKSTGLFLRLTLALCRPNLNFEVLTWLLSAEDGLQGQPAISNNVEEVKEQFHTHEVREPEQWRSST